ncbi:hypothetical protein ACF0H5_022381 [Mactra antiquata]
MEAPLNNSDEILIELNREEVIRDIPLIVFLSLICLLGSLGNGLVFYVYKTKYTSSNCRTFVLFLSLVDLFSAGFVVPVEIVVISREYIFKNENVCKMSVFLNTWPTLTSGLLLLAIAMDRYRKVCKPFGWQISRKVARTMCFLTSLVGIAFSWIPPIIYGVQERPHPEHPVIVSECVETEAWKNTVFPLINNILWAFLFLGALGGIIVMYCFIAVHVRRHIERKAALGIKRDTIAVEPLEASELTIMSGKVVIKRQGNENRNKQNKNACDSSADMFRNSNSVDTKPSLSTGEPSEIEQKRLVVCSIDDHIALEGSNNRKSILSRMFSFGRSSLALTKSVSLSSNTKVYTLKRKGDNQQQKHRTAFIMFLISIAFIVSYLPLLCILIVRTADSKFVVSLSDSGRTAYKFFLRSYYFNCAINPFIYGLWDSRFRKHTKKLICRT